MTLHANRLDTLSMIFIRAARTAIHASFFSCFRPLDTRPSSSPRPSNLAIDEHCPGQQIQRPQVTNVLIVRRILVFSHGAKPFRKLLSPNTLLQSHPAELTVFWVVTHHIARNHNWQRAARFLKDLVPAVTEVWRPALSALQPAEFSQRPRSFHNRNPDSS